MSQVHRPSKKWYTQGVHLSQVHQPSRSGILRGCTCLNCTNQVEVTPTEQEVPNQANCIVSLVGALETSALETSAPPASTAPPSLKLSHPLTPNPIMPHITFLNRRSDILIRCGHLPHWFQPEAVQFITFRLADSLPQTKLQELALMREALGRRDTTDGELTAEEERLEEIVEGWLKIGYGGCVLSNAQCRQFVEEALFFNDKQAYHLHAFVIMPNHVHILLSPIGENSVVSIVSKLKRYSSRMIKQCVGTDGNVWQREMFDRMMRGEDDFAHKLAYIVNNPNALPEDSYSLYVADNVQYLL